MAIYHMDVKTFGRSRGGRVTRAAAYRAGERIRDERTREVYNHTDRDDVVYKDITLPAEFAGNVELDWARHRECQELVGVSQDSRYRTHRRRISEELGGISRA